MSEDLHSDYLRISSQLSKVTDDLHKILNEFNCIAPKMENSSSLSPQQLQPSTSCTQFNKSDNCTCYNSRHTGYADWFLSPLHEPYHMRSDDYMINQHYRPGYLGALFDLKNTTDINEHKFSEECLVKYLNAAKCKNLFDCKSADRRLLDKEIFNLNSNNREDQLFNINVQMAKLRLDKLHLKEEILLETKRQQELERTRPPRKFWYMLRTKEFTTEHLKNQNMLKYYEYLNDILNYRKQLLKASRDAKRHFLQCLY
ncbi:uncharacterized protein LOC106867315 [Octopus bimaculoides]|uniref:Uncharacterized protein n=1 Tax=Octopus bimaculoides TaxID=37653 RepID=A0A0L8I1C3_OCTBM|nr:uncharacterized protein LOC106867315 [Octopus bimaculoides]XP_014767641.1 uncharacterized protein LOC106867315 [Octopus bimaculoides]|eukprot:XP_014767639.1 PREDICTED: uncharacterized protein LOC106867315 [Octopus bimaculoides]